MSHRAARITYDEVTRIVKAVRDVGLPIGKVVFNGELLSVEIADDNGDKPARNLANASTVAPLLRKPKAAASMPIKLEYLVTRPNKDGTLRYYFKRRGQPVTRIHGEPMSEHFMIQYRARLEWVAPDGANSEEP
ncbi:hypothetical protein [Mesorhizobium sp. WSM3868]|uniref:hypothetical protein n=1 Tax=Mesorhizobium sp. WSM3868 TaxID=2029405 RepID=UPI000BAEAFAB|nr:hypothetical protein [Mesorhizobium sp. WSM3868]PBB32063.1 hypothetical protein CK221_25715 [Mesorhizobium sp. WSM3868]